MPADNPLLADWTTPHEMPPFADIRPEHFRPAFDAALKAHSDEIAAVAGGDCSATFENTIAALERSGRPLRKVSSTFFNLVSADTSPELQEIERDIAPLLAKHHSDIYLNEALYARVAELAAQQETLDLTDEKARVLERYAVRFERAGARLDAAGKARMAETGQRLAELSTQFAQNVLADESAFRLVLEGEDDLAGLPDFLRNAAAQTAADLGLPGKHVITLARSSIDPFLQFSERRDLREQAFKAWTSRGANGGETDNRALIAETVALRTERANLLGFDSFAQFKLDDTMAKTPEAVRDLLMQVWAPGLDRAARERDALQDMARYEGGNFEIAAWDWRYYAAKVRKAEHDLDDAEIKPYFQLERMIEAVFDTAHRLFGLTFEERNDLPTYHPDVRVWEVSRPDSSLVGLFCGDYFARPSKQSGAWMSAFRSQQKLAGDITPIIVNVTNFVKGAPGEPTLLSFEDARTLFHEFGHALHGLLSDRTYPTLAGTSVSGDFVELPSQLYEHWLMRPEVLRRFAVHAETGAPLPEELLDRIVAAQTFNQGFRYGRVRLVLAGRPGVAFGRRRRAHRCGPVRGNDARSDRHARGDHHATSAAAFPASLQPRLCRRLLQLSLVGGDGCRRLPGLRGGRRRVRSGDRATPTRFHLFRRQPQGPGGCLCRLSRPSRQPSMPCFRNEGWRGRRRQPPEDRNDRALNRFQPLCGQIDSGRLARLVVRSIRAAGPRTHLLAHCGLRNG